MKYLTLGFLALSCLPWLGCASTTWDNIEKTVAASAVVAQDAQAAVAALKAKVTELQEKQAAQIAEIETITGAIDADGDGDVTTAEVAAAFKKLKDSPEGLNLLADWETYVALGGMWASMKLAGKGGAVVVKKLHKTGRAMVDADGDGQPDAPA